MPAGPVRKWESAITPQPGFGAHKIKLCGYLFLLLTGREISRGYDSLPASPEGHCPHATYAKYLITYTFTRGIYYPQREYRGKTPEKLLLSRVFLQASDVLGRAGGAQKGSRSCVTTWQRDPQLGSCVSALS